MWTGEGDRSLFNLGLDERTMQREKPLTGTERLRGLFRGAVSRTGLDQGRFHAAAPDNATLRTLRDAFDCCLAVAELGRPHLEPDLKHRLSALSERCGRLGLAACETVLKQVSEAEGTDWQRALMDAVYVLNGTRMMMRPMPWLGAGAA